MRSKRATRSTVVILPSFALSRDQFAPPLLETPMYNCRSLTLAINSFLIGPVGMQLSYSGYIIASS